MTPSISLLRTFVTVVEAGGVRSAAERLGRTPSAVSMALTQFEETVCAPLFEEGRKSRLTRAGQFALEQARDLLRHYERSMSALRDFVANATGRVDVASVPSVAHALLPAAIRLCQLHRPDVVIDVRDMDSRAVNEAVNRGGVEFGFATLRPHPPGIVSLPLFTDLLHLVCRVDDPLAGNARPVAWRDLAGHTILLNGICEMIESPEFSALVAGATITVRNVTSLRALVAAGVGVTVLPRLDRALGSDALAFVPFADPGAVRKVGLVRRHGERLTPAAEAFVRWVVEVTRTRAVELGLEAVQDPLDTSPSS